MFKTSCLKHRHPWSALSTARPLQDKHEAPHPPHWTSTSSSLELSSAGAWFNPLPNPVSGPRSLRGQLTLYKEGILSPEINQSLMLINTCVCINVFNVY